MENIKIPIYYCKDNYDFEEMASELENRISDLLGRNVLITISEVEEE